MNLAVLSGKGGTGKTLAAVNLAEVAGPVLYLDCDVEEPNGRLFFQPQQVGLEEIALPVPVVDQEVCDGCRQCVDFCRFNALAYIRDRLIVFEEVCHACGGCVLVCPQKAIHEKDRVIGRIESGLSDQVLVHSGILNTGEESGIPILHRLLEIRQERPDLPAFMDGPPGTACIVLETAAAADYCLLVAEPTVFGAHNLALIHQLVTLMGKPCGVLLNKCLEGDNPSDQYCREQGIPIMGRLPFDPALGLLNSRGEIAARADEGWRQVFTDIYGRLAREAGL